MRIIPTTTPGTLIQNIKSGKTYKMLSKPSICAAGYMVVSYKAIGEDGKSKGPIITSKIENMQMLTRPV